MIIEYYHKITTNNIENINNKRDNLLSKTECNTFHVRKLRKTDPCEARYYISFLTIISHLIQIRIFTHGYSLKKDIDSLNKYLISNIS